MTATRKTIESLIGTADPPHIVMVTAWQTEVALKKPSAIDGLRLWRLFQEAFPRREEHPEELLDFYAQLIRATAVDEAGRLLFASDEAYGRFLRTPAPTIWNVLRQLGAEAAYESGFLIRPGATEETEDTEESHAAQKKTDEPTATPATSSDASPSA